MCLQNVREVVKHILKLFSSAAFKELGEDLSVTLVLLCGVELSCGEKSHNIFSTMIFLDDTG